MGSLVGFSHWPFFSPGLGLLLCSYKWRPWLSSRTAVSLLVDETAQMRKVILHNRMILDLIMPAQGGTCALLHTECCIYIPNHQEQVQSALKEVDTQVQAIHALIEDPLTYWRSHLSSTWCWVTTFVAVMASTLLILCCALYFCCGLWVQGMALREKVQSQTM